MYRLHLDNTSAQVNPNGSKLDWHAKRSADFWVVSGFAEKKTYGNLMLVWVLYLFFIRFAILVNVL